MSEWTHKNNIVYDENGKASADCRYKKGLAAQIVREHNAFREIMAFANDRVRLLEAKKTRVEESETFCWEEDFPNQAEELRLFGAVLARAEGRE